MKLRVTTKQQIIYIDDLFVILKYNVKPDVLIKTIFAEYLNKKIDYEREFTKEGLIINCQLI